MKLRIWWIAITLTLVAGLPVVGESEPDPGNQVDASDDTQVYLSVMTGYFEREADQMRRYLDLCEQPDDLAVLMFLADRTGRSPEFLQTLRNQDLGWWEISQGMGVEPGVWFLAVRYQPKPPFDRAYAHWDNSKSSEVPLVLTDDECRHLVAARVLHECCQVTVARAMEMRASGKDLMQLTAWEYRNQQRRKEQGKKEVAVYSRSGNGQD